MQRIEDSDDKSLLRLCERLQPLGVTHRAWRQSSLRDTHRSRHPDQFFDGGREHSRDLGQKQN
jgi:hypothetical protein